MRPVLLSLPPPCSPRNTSSGPTRIFQQCAQAYLYSRAHRNSTPTRSVRRKGNWLQVASAKERERDGKKLLACRALFCECISRIIQAYVCIYIRKPFNLEECKRSHRPPTRASCYMRNLLRHRAIYFRRSRGSLILHIALSVYLYTHTRAI